MSDKKLPCPLCMDGCEGCNPREQRARAGREPSSDMWDEHRALVADSVPSYEDLPEHVPWLDREGGLKREDFMD